MAPQPGIIAESRVDRALAVLRHGMAPDLTTPDTWTKEKVEVAFRSGDATEACLQIFNNAPPTWVLRLPTNSGKWQLPERWPKSYGPRTYGIIFGVIDAPQLLEHLSDTVGGKAPEQTPQGPTLPWNVRTNSLATDFPAGRYNGIMGWGTLSPDEFDRRVATNQKRTRQEKGKHLPDSQRMQEQEGMEWAASVALSRAAETTGLVAEWEWGADVFVADQHDESPNWERLRGSSSDSTLSTGPQAILLDFGGPQSTDPSIRKNRFSFWHAPATQSRIVAIWIPSSFLRPLAAGPEQAPAGEEGGEDEFEEDDFT